MSARSVQVPPTLGWDRAIAIVRPLAIEQLDAEFFALNGSNHFGRDPVCFFHQRV